MAKSMASRKYQITINNPLEHGFSHDTIKNILNAHSGVEYWCLCDEIGSEGTPHTHVYVVFANAVMFTTLQKRFYGAHIEWARGSNKENRDYIRKEGKWLEDEKRGTNMIDSFEESGEMPPDREDAKKETAEIYEMIKNGASNYEIDVQEWLGHSDIKMTANLYSHLDVARKKSMADMFASQLTIQAL